jgi:hypothetical protein
MGLRRDRDGSLSRGTSDRARGAGPAAQKDARKASTASATTGAAARRSASSITSASMASSSSCAQAHRRPRGVSQDREPHQRLKRPRPTRMPVPGAMRQPAMRAGRAHRVASADALQQHGELHPQQCAGRHRRRRPDKAVLLQVFGEKAQALAVSPQHFDRVLLPTTKHEGLSRERVRCEVMMREAGKGVEALSHVGLAGCQSDPGLEITGIIVPAMPRSHTAGGRPLRPPRPASDDRRITQSRWRWSGRLVPDGENWRCSFRAVERRRAMLRNVRSSSG